MGIEELGEGKTDECGGREIVSFRAKKALVGAGARILFYPTLVYNVLRNKIQADFRWWDEIDQFLLLGAVPFPNDVPRLQQLGVRGVITLNEPYETLVPSNIYKVHGMDHLVIPTRDYLYAPSPVDICRAVDFIHRNASHGKITYVHCKAGRGRSATIVLCYLVKYKNMTPMAALEYVRSRRPRVLLAPSQWQTVEAYNKNKLKFPAIQIPKPKHPHTQDVEASDECSEDERDRISLCSDAKTSATSPIHTHHSPVEEDCFITEEDLEGYESFPDAYDDNATSSTSEEEVLITDKDLQGYETFVDAFDENSTPCPIDDEVLITEADLEEYETFLDACDENIISSNHVHRGFLSYDDHATSSTSEGEFLIADKDLGYETFVDALNDNTTPCPIEDEVLITEADFEGYETFLDARDENSFSSNHVNQTFPKTRKLSCFWSSLGRSDGNLPVSSQHPPIRLASS